MSDSNVSRLRLIRDGVDPEFRAAFVDPHNLFPADGEVNNDRGNHAYGNVPGEPRLYGVCDFEVGSSPKVAEPDKCVRGELARAMLYMEDQHGARLEMERDVLLAWHEAENHQFLPYGRVSDALARVRAADRWIGERLLLEFLVLTAVRTNEARGALWSEIDWAARKWTIPGERMKERKQHEVPLSIAALAVLREARVHPDLEDVRQRANVPDLVFPSLNGRLLYNNGLANFVKELQLACVPHGFRSSFSTWSAEMGHDFALAEICLSHAVGSEVSRRYRRTGLFVPRIPIMEEWGRYVASVRSVAPADSDPTLTADPRASVSVTPGVSYFDANLRGRDFVVGDVHGCFRTLERALAELDFEPGRDRLFGVGDLVNRGPHSVAALEWLEQHFEAVALGNHDRAVLRWFETPLGMLPPAGSEWLAEVPEGERGRWCAALAAMPVAIVGDRPNGATHVRVNGATHGC